MPKAKKPKRKLSAYNRHMSREMKKGRTFKQAVASWKKTPTRRARAVGAAKRGVATVRKRRATRRATRAARRTTRARRRTTTTRRSNRVGRRGGFSTQKLFKLVRMAALVAPVAGAIMQHGMTEEGARVAMQRITGVDFRTGQFHMSSLAEGWTGYLAAVGVTYGIPKIAGIIRGL